MDRGESYGDLVWRDFRRNRQAFIALCSLIPIVLLAIFAPAIASSRPFVFIENGTRIYPWFRELFVAKGVDYLAKRIRQIGEANEVPIIENPPLARALYAAVEVDQEIPQEHYKAVAEVIGFVMRLKGKRIAS